MPTVLQLPAGAGVSSGAQLANLKPQQELELLRDDIRHLLANTPKIMTRAASTGVTMLSAAVAGGIDGALGEKNNLGPARINVWIAGGAAVASLVMDGSPDAEEGAAAVARGFGAAMVYAESKERSAAMRAKLTSASAAPATKA